jgi:uncharacterized membrane protein
MSFQQVPAGSGPQWLIGAVNLILKNPAPFALMGLLVGVISMVPLLGALALMLLGPALNGGIMYAAHSQESGRPADFAQLFQAFREEGKLGKMIVLCLPGIVAAVVIGVLAVVFIGSALLGAGATASSSDVGAAAAALFGVGGIIFLTLALALGLASYALTLFATPQVMLESADPIAAMKQSLSACLANVGAVLLFLLLCFGASVLLIVLVSWIPLIGPLLMMVVLLPVFAVASYLAWRQVYRRDITQELPPVIPPAPPSVEV